MSGLFKKIIDILGRVFQMLMLDEETARQMAERYAPYFRSLEIEAKDAKELEKVKEVKEDKEDKEKDKNLHHIRQEEQRELIAGRK